MAATPIPVTTAPFQGGVNGTLTIGGSAMAAALEMNFVNDGYTILVVNNQNTATNITITSVPDSAGRVQNIGPVAMGVSGGAGQTITRVYGPFRPLWWNFGGVVTVTFSQVTGVSVAALSLQF